MKLCFVNIFLNFLNFLNFHNFTFDPAKTEQNQKLFSQVRVRAQNKKKNIKNWNYFHLLELFVIQWWIDDWRKALKRSKKFFFSSIPKENVKFAELNRWSVVVSLSLSCFVWLVLWTDKRLVFNVFSIIIGWEALIWFFSISTCMEMEWTSRCVRSSVRSCHVTKKYRMWTTAIVFKMST